MKNHIWPWFDDEFKVSCESNGDYRKIISWKGAQPGGTNSLPDGSVRYDVIVPRSLHNRTAKLLGLPNRVRDLLKRQESLSQVVVTQQGEKQHTPISGRSEAMISSEGLGYTFFKIPQQVD